MKLGIVVLNYQNYMQTITCVEYLEKASKDAMILVVDNASTNDSFERIKERFSENNNVQVIANSENVGYARGNNKGIRHLLGKFPEMEYFCIMNPDVEIYDEDFFDKTTDVLERNQNIAVISGFMISNGVFDSSLAGWMLPSRYDVIFRGPLCKQSRTSLRMIDSRGLIIVEAVSGSCFLIRRSVLEQIGLLNENTFMYNEENILGNKLKELGYQVAVLPQCVFYHNHIQSKKREWAFRNKYKFCKRWYESRRHLLNECFDGKGVFLLEIMYYGHVLYFFLIECLGFVCRKLEKSL